MWNNQKIWSLKGYRENHEWDKCDYRTFTHRIQSNNLKRKEAIKPERINGSKREYYDNYKGKKCAYWTYIARIRNKYMTLENAIQPCSFQ